jgi:hypothetical protein
MTALQYTHTYRSIASLVAGFISFFGSFFSVQIDLPASVPRKGSQQHCDSVRQRSLPQLSASLQLDKAAIAALEPTEAVVEQGVVFVIYC